MAIGTAGEVLVSAPHVGRWPQDVIWGSPTGLYLDDPLEGLASAEDLAALHAIMEVTGRLWLPLGGVAGDPSSCGQRTDARVGVTIRSRIADAPGGDYEDVAGSSHGSPTGDSAVSQGSRSSFRRAEDGSTQ